MAHSMTLDEVDLVPTPVPDGDQGTGRRRRLGTAVIVAVMAVIPRLASVGYGFNGDEFLWMKRIESFSAAVRHGHPSHMSASYPTWYAKTMPGVPDLWLGSLGQSLWRIAARFGFIHPSAPFDRSTSGYVFAEAMVALATALLIGLLVWLVASWTSVRVGAVVGVVLATEPFWVSLGAILHLDELVVLFAMCGLVGLAWALGLPDPDVKPKRPGRWIALAAVACTLSVLTKLSGAAIAPAIVGMLVWDAVRRVRTRPPEMHRWSALRPTWWIASGMTLVALITVAVTYPAMILDPVTQYRALTRSLTIVTTDRETFFLGHVGGTADLRFYPVTLAYNVTWWLFLLLPVALVTAMVRRRTRVYAVLVVAWTLVPAVSIAVSDARYSRYGLIVLGPLVLAGSFAVFDWTPRSAAIRTWTPRIGAVLAVGAFAWSVWTAPWGMVTYNPLATRVREPLKTFEVGWGEAPAVALPMVQRHAESHGLECEEVTVAALFPHVEMPLPHGSCQPRVVSYRAEPDYVFSPIRRLQRVPLSVAANTRDMDFVGVGTANGQPVTAVWARKGIGGR